MIRWFFEGVAAAFIILGIVVLLVLPEKIETIIAALDRIEARLEETCR